MVELITFETMTNAKNSYAGYRHLRIDGRRDHLWRAVDQDGCVLDIPVQPCRDPRAAKRFFRKLLKGLRYVPRVIVTDPLKSDEVTRNERIPGIEHRPHQGLNNRAEWSHPPTRQRERQRRRFKSTGHAQRLLSAHGPINNPRSTTCFVFFATESKKTEIRVK